MNYKILKVLFLINKTNKMNKLGSKIRKKNLFLSFKKIFDIYIKFLQYLIYQYINTFKK